MQYVRMMAIWGEEKQKGASLSHVKYLFTHCVKGLNFSKIFQKESSFFGSVNSWVNPRMIYNRMDTKIHLHRSNRSPLMRDVFVLQKLELAITTIKSHFHSINKRLLLFTVFCEHPCLLRPLVPSLS